MTEEQKPDSPDQDTSDAPSQRRFSRSGLWLTTLGLLLLLVVATALLIGPYLHYRWTKRSPTPVAVYDGFSLRQDPEFFELVTDPDAEKMGPVFVRIPDGRTFPLGELPEEAAAQLLAKGPPRDPPTGTNEYTDAKSFLTYREGRLVFAVLHAKSGLFRVGRSATGEFSALPLHRGQLIATFGEPLRWQQTAQAPAEDEGEPGL